MPQRCVTSRKRCCRSIEGIGLPGKQVCMSECERKRLVIKESEWGTDPDKCGCLKNLITLGFAQIGIDVEFVP